MKKITLSICILVAFCCLFTGCGSQVDIPRLTSPQASDKVLSCPLPEGCEIRDISSVFGLDQRFVVYGVFTETGVRVAYVTLYSNESSILVMATIKVSLSCEAEDIALGLQWANDLLALLYPKLDGKLMEELTQDCPWDASSLMALELGETLSNALEGESQKLVYDLLGGHYASIQLWYDVSAKN